MRLQGMPMSRFRYIAAELKEHAPFTAFGAGVGVVVMAAVWMAGLASSVYYNAFHILHPAHLLLSSAVTATMFRRHGGSVLPAVAIGIGGAIAICTISDIVLPHLGGAALGGSMTLHLEIVEHPWLAILPALAGAAAGALALRWTRCPHAAHVLISTLASLFYLIGFGELDWLPMFPLVFAVLFIAVWVPCCTSDIIFPLLFTRRIKRH